MSSPAAHAGKLRRPNVMMSIPPADNAELIAMIQRGVDEMRTRKNWERTRLPTSPERVVLSRMQSVEGVNRTIVGRAQINSTTGEITLPKGFNLKLNLAEMPGQPIADP